MPLAFEAQDLLHVALQLSNQNPYYSDSSEEDFSPKPFSKPYLRKPNRKGKNSATRSRRVDDGDTWSSDESKEMPDRRMTETRNPNRTIVNVKHSVPDRQEPSFSFTVSEDQDMDQQARKLDQDISEFSLGSSHSRNRGPEASQYLRDSETSSLQKDRIQPTVEGLHPEVRDSAVIPVQSSKAAAIPRKMESPDSSATSRTTKIVSLPLHPVPTNPAVVLATDSERTVQIRATGKRTQKNDTSQTHPVGSSTVQEILAQYQSHSDESDSSEYTAAAVRSFKCHSTPADNSNSSGSNCLADERFSHFDANQPARAGSHGDLDKQRGHVPPEILSCAQPTIAAGARDSYVGHKEAKSLESEAAKCVENSLLRLRGAETLAGVAPTGPVASVRTGRGVVEQTLASWLRESSSGAEDGASRISDVGATGTYAEFKARDDKAAASRRDFLGRQLGGRAWSDSEGGGLDPSQPRARMECTGPTQLGHAGRGPSRGVRGDEDDSILDMVASTVNGGGLDGPSRGDKDEDRRVDAAGRRRRNVT